MRREAPYQVPHFPRHNDAPLIYVSFGSLGAADTAMIQRLIDTLQTLPYRFLINVGAYVPGSDPLLDEAMRRHLQLVGFLTQPMNEYHDFASCLTQLEQVLTA